MFIYLSNIIPIKPFNTFSSLLIINNKRVHLTLPIMHINHNSLALTILYCKEVNKINQ